MSLPFNPSEILEMAEQIERNGARFYRLAAEGTVDSRNRQLLVHLAAMEDEHEKTFASMRANPTKLFTGKETMEDILQKAMGLEKDSIVFYLGMKELVPERLGKGKVDAIIKEEMNHLASLGSELAALRRDQS